MTALEPGIPGREDHMSRYIDPECRCVAGGSCPTDCICSCHEPDSVARHGSSNGHADKER
jgi:hypothetical protein